MAICGHEFDDGACCMQRLNHEEDNVPHLRYGEGREYWEKRRAVAEYELIDLMGSGMNEMYCSCGVRLFPDCDISAASINEEFRRHIREAHGVPLP